MLKDMASSGSTAYKGVRLAPLVRATMRDITRTNCNYSLEAPSIKGCWIYNFDPLQIIAILLGCSPIPSSYAKCNWNTPANDSLAIYLHSLNI
jgi:hypothetical protein